MPAVVEPLDFESIYQEQLAYFQSSMGDGWTAVLESDPVVKLIELAAYREVILRGRVNDAARAVMLAYATGSDLDQIGANYQVERLLIDPGDVKAIPPRQPAYEADEDYRRRIQLSFEGYTTAGSEQSYIFHGLSADPEVLDVSAISPGPGAVTVYVLVDQALAKLVSRDRQMGDFVWFYFGAKWPALRIAREHSLSEAKVRELVKAGVAWIDCALERLRDVE